MKLLIFFLLPLLTFTSCKGTMKKAENTKQQETPYLDPNYKYVHLIPDSLRTPEQKQLIIKLRDAQVKYLVVENNHIVLKISKKDYVAKGLPEQYYVLMQKDVHNINSYIDKNGLKGVNKMFKDSYAAYK